MYQLKGEVMQIVNKITMKVVMGKDVKEFVIKDEQVDLVQIVGMAKKKEIFKSTFGGKIEESWCIFGEVKAKNLQTGEIFYSPNRCFLPKLGGELLAAQMDDTDQNAVKWAFVLGVKYSTAQIGYEYTLKPLLKPAENNALDNIEKEIQALPAPKPQENANIGRLVDPSEVIHNA